MSQAIEGLRSQLSAGAVSIDIGVGGGGRGFTQWLGGVLGLGQLGSSRRTDVGLESTFTRGKIVDAAGFPVAGSHGHIAGTVRVEVGIEEHSAAVPVSATEVAEQFLRRSLGGSSGALSVFVDRFGLATSLVDVPDWASVAASYEDSGYIRRLEGVARKSESFREHFRAIQAAGGSRLLDLGRIIYLLAPEPMHLGDEWASLASANSNRVYSLADINLVLSEFTDLFLLDSSSEVPTVEAANPFVRMLFSGFVPASSSEYVDIFRWMSQRAVASLVRTDASDSFIRSALPMVAARGGCLPALLEDGAAMLASDVTRLADYLERDPRLMASPGAKALLLHAHRLGADRQDREAQMEFALRRMALMTEADRIAEALPERAWRPVWSSTSPTNVHRIVSEDPAGVLALAAVEGRSPFCVYAALGNGRLRQLRRTRSTLLETGSTGREAEIRGLAAIRFGDADLVVAAASDASIRAYRVSDPDGTPRAELLWEREEPMRNPLTTTTIWHRNDGSLIVLSGGVSGSVWRHDLETGGEDLGALLEWDAEIRGIRVIRVGGDDHAVVAAVDGRIAVIDLRDGAQAAGTTLVEEDRLGLLTPSCVDALEVGGRVHVLVGCATGEVFKGKWTPGGSLSLEELRMPGVPPSGVNEVVLRFDGIEGVQSYVARNDGVWLKYDSKASRPVKAFVGHAGPVLSQTLVRVPKTGEVLSLTGGAEGTVRIWRHIHRVDEALAYLRVNRHRGAIRAVTIRSDHADLEVVTGGDDGDVRLWRGAHASRGAIISQHQGNVTSFLWLAADTGVRLVVGATDGTLRLAFPDDTGEPARLLGIAHEGVTALASSPTGGVFWSAGNDGGITRWDALAGMARATRVVCFYGGVVSMITDGQGRPYVGGQDGSLSLVDPQSLEVLRRRSFESAVTSLDVVPELGLLVVGLANGRVFTIDPRQGFANANERELHRHNLGVVAARTVDLHGQVAIASVSRDRRLAVVDVNSRAILHEIGLEGFPTDLSTSDRRIAVSTTAGVTLFEFAAGHLSAVRG